MVSAWGTGKSLCGITKGMELSREYPDNLGVIFRQEFTDLRDSTLRDFSTYTGLEADGSRDVVLENKSTIMFRHIEEMNNIQNINLGWFWIEQAEELETDEEFFILWGRLRRAGIPHQGYITANTKGHNWIWRLWKQGKLKGNDLIEATTFDNEDNLPADFMASLETLKLEKPHLYARFVMNSWEESDTIDQVLQPQWVQDSIDRQLVSVEGMARRVVVIDPARYGDDETVIYGFQGYKIIDSEITRQVSTMETAGKAIIMRDRINAGGIACDEIGIGAGIVDRLKELRQIVIPINSASASNKPERYRNLRAEIWDTGAQKFYNGQASIPKDDKLIEQLLAPKYKTIESNGKLLIESKEDIKKRLGCSPDRADTYMMGLWAVDRVGIFPVKYVLQAAGRDDRRERKYQY